jgi:hypothetical protein
MTPMTFIFQLCNSFVERVQFVFELANFVLNRETDERDIYQLLVASLYALFLGHRVNLFAVWS